MADNLDEKVDRLLELAVRIDERTQTLDTRVTHVEADVEDILGWKNKVLGVAAAISAAFSIAWNYFINKGTGNG